MRFGRTAPRGQIPIGGGTKQQQQRPDRFRRRRWRWLSSPVAARILVLAFVAACVAVHARYLRAVLVSLESNGDGRTTTDHLVGDRKNNNNIGNQKKEQQQQQQQKQDQHYHRKRPLNIVLFYADDWTHKTLGLLNPSVKTPVIDWLAGNGVLFTHNCVTTSICMISRATLYTGQYASVHKTYRPKDRAMYRPGRWNATLFPLLRERGYHNGMVGKWHHGRPPAASRTFGTFENYHGTHYIESKPIPTYHRHNRSITTRTVMQHVTEKNEQDAVRFLDTRPRDKPFCLMVSFFATHAEDGHPEQYRPQNRTRFLYAPNETVPVPKTATPDHFRRLPRFLRDPRNTGRVRWGFRYKTPWMYQIMMKKMYRMATEVDLAIGAVLDKLREQKVLGETLVVFTTDNGNLHGEHGLAEKCA